MARPLDNPWLESWLRGIRTRFGLEVVSNRGGLRRLFAAQKERRSVAVLVDLNHRGKSVFVDFFGHKAATAATAAVLSLQAGRPLVPVFAHRASRPMHFEIEFGEPLWPDLLAPRSEEIHRLLQAATSCIENHIRAAPDQWLWTHRRWKTRPEDEMGAAAGDLDE